MSDLRGLSKPFLVDFIKLYEIHPCLWNLKLKEYSDRVLKKQAYVTLLTKLQEAIPDATKEIVVKKIDSLRGNFRKELKKVNYSKKSGAVGRDLYTPRLWYYENLCFLKEQKIRSRTDFKTKSNEKPSSTCTVAPTSSPVTIAVASPSSQHCQSPQENIFKFSHHSPYSFSTEYQNTPPSRSQHTHQERDGHICSSCPCISAQETEYDKFGKTLATELQKMTPEQQIYAKRAFAEIIFEGQLGALHRDSVVINRISVQRLHNEHETSTYIIEKTEPDYDY